MSEATLDKVTLRLAMDLNAKYATDYAEYLAECEHDRRNGHRPHYCEHGMNLWVDWDPMCGLCEDGLSMGDPMARRRRALDVAKERAGRADQLLRWVAESVRLGVNDAVDMSSVGKRIGALFHA